MTSKSTLKAIHYFLAERSGLPLGQFHFASQLIFSILCFTFRGIICNKNKQWPLNNLHRMLFLKFLHTRFIFWARTLGVHLLPLNRFALLISLPLYSSLPFLELIPVLSITLLYEFFRSLCLSSFEFLFLTLLHVHGWVCLWKYIAFVILTFIITCIVRSFST